ncbi:MAG: enoyl-CoA hydratase/isomerase family protein [Candidatus Hermodarchaeota archaeon]
METENPTISIENKIATITLNCPMKGNTLTPEILREIEDLFNKISKNKEVNVVVLTGGEKIFSAGFDLHYIKTLENESKEEFITLFLSTYRAIMSCTQPVIAAIAGAAFAGGFDLALMCDIRYASKTAKFSQREITLSITPFLDPLWRIIGFGRVKELALTGRIYDAYEAERMGFVNKVFSEESLMENVRKIAHTIASYNRECLKEVKNLANLILNNNFNTYLDLQEINLRKFFGTIDYHTRINRLLKNLKERKK